MLYSPYLKSTLFLGVLLFGSTIAVRIDEVARRGGFHPNAIRDLAAHELASRSVAKTKPRYLNAKTEKYFVKSLPEVPQSFMTEMYSGLIPIEEGDPNRALFFVFQPRVGPPVDEVTIWMNGGPGCSSLEGFLQENGLIKWSWGQYTPVIEPYSWVNLTNMLWVEQPVGTGFSIGKPNATSQEDIASDFVKFFKNFEKIFGIKNNDIYVTGESYAGRYVPYIANAMLDEDDKTYFNMKGILVYDPCIGQYDAGNDIYISNFIEQNNNVLGYNESFLEYMAEKDVSCGYKKYREEYFQFPPSGMQPPLPEAKDKCAGWGDAYLAAYAPNPCFNVYEIGLQCPLLSDPLGYPTDLQYYYPGLFPVYFNRTDVKKAMHAPMDVDWLECAPHPVFVGGSHGSGGPEGLGDLSADPIQKVLPRVIEATNRVLVANGDLDMEVLTNGTLLSIQNMTWNGKMGFQSIPSKPINIKLPDLEYEETFAFSGFPPIDAHQGIMGKQHYERGLMWAETYLSGHMQPQFQPRSTYRHLQWVLGRIDEL